MYILKIEYSNAEQASGGAAEAAVTALSALITFMRP